MGACSSYLFFPPPSPGRAGGGGGGGLVLVLSRGAWSLHSLELTISHSLLVSP